MIDVAILAQQAMSVIGPLLPLAASKLAESVGSESGKKMFGWLSAKVKGTPAETCLNEAVAEPDNMLKQEILRLQIQDLAKKDEDFRSQLANILKEIAATSDSVKSMQTATVTGDNNRTIQVTGQGNSIQTG